MRILCIDIGNTRTHCAAVDCPDAFGFDVASGCAGAPRNGLPAEPECYRIEARADYPSDRFADIFCEKNLCAGADAVSWCSVVPKYSKALESKMGKGRDTMQLTFERSPIPLDIDFPQTLGQDRIADAVGAGVFMRPPYLVVDMGTAVTIDLVDKNGRYAGGAIAPGMDAFSQYLSTRTAQLPPINPAEADCGLVIGKNTVEAMYVGCAKGFCRLIDGLIADIEREYFSGESAQSKTIFTGGSVSLLPKEWVGARLVNRDLAFIGLAKSFLIDRKKI